METKNTYGMKVCCISDLHGQIPTIDPASCDYLLIAGDIFPLDIQRDVEECDHWLKEVFLPWCSLFKQTIFVAGNHDFYFERVKQPRWTKVDNYKYPSNVRYLENDVYDDGFIKVYGTPECHIFGHWAFMKSDDAQRAIHKEVLANHDFTGKQPFIILSHDAPYGCSDICFEAYWQNTKHIGNEVLTELINEAQPDWFIHGHLHTANHEIELLGDTKVVNVSYIDEGYHAAFKPFYFDI